MHHANAKAGQNFDSVTCTSTTGSPLTWGAAGQPGSIGWASDFNGQGSTLHFTESADGLSYTGTTDNYAA